MFKVPEKCRVKSGAWASDASYGNNGQFIIRHPKFPLPLLTQASDGDKWEHVSVSTHLRCPTWKEMCFVKDKFWDEDDFVVQLHVPKSDWVNCHPFCLHLWRKKGTNDFCERPPMYMVGPKNKVN